MAAKELRPQVLWILRALGMIALGISIYIIYVTYAGGQLAGCTQGGGCEEVIHTKWSKWFGLPVGVGGALVYASILFLLFRPLNSVSWRRLVTLTFLAAGSGLWFISLQLFVIKGFCIYCTTVHSCGILVMALTLIFAPVEPPPQTPKEAKKRGDVLLASQVFQQAIIGLLGVAVLAGGQLMSNGSSNEHQISNTVKGTLTHLTTHQVSMAGGQLQVKVGEYPTLGNVDAQRTVIMIFDYTCPACRRFHPSLDAALVGHESTASVVLMPVPLDSQCNPGVRETAYMHLNACQFAKMGLAVWNSKPSAYAAFDKFMFTGEFPPSLEEARKMADHLVGKETMDAAMASQQYDDLLHYSVDLFSYAVFTRKVLPTLITPEQVIEGTPEPAQLSTLF